jgi:ABC-type lipoprotein release transport system permease subunit
MLSLKLAFRNLMGAGLRTWLNVFVLSLSFVVIIWHKGMLDGWDRQAKTDMISWECGGGQYWHSSYDPFDPFTLSESHGKIPVTLKKGIKFTPVLISQGSIYPGGRIQSVLIKGIDPSQTILSIPSYKLDTSSAEIPVLIGQYMAKANRLKKGDIFSVRWRTADGAFDAADAVVADIFKTTVPTVDASQVWVSLPTLQLMLGTPGEATILVLDRSSSGVAEISGWHYKGLEILLSDVDKVIQAKSASGMVLWFILLLLAMLAIFDTQVLSIFRRQKEIGTCVALGMTKGQVIRLFTVEGAMHSVFAAIVAFIWGTPLLWWQAKSGIKLPVDGKDFGLSISEVLYPQYGLGLILSTTLVVLITTTIVSYLPSRKIAKMNPTEAIRGKIK